MCIRNYHKCRIWFIDFNTENGKNKQNFFVLPFNLRISKGKKEKILKFMEKVLGTIESIKRKI